MPPHIEPPQREQTPAFPSACQLPDAPLLPEDGDAAEKGLLSFPDSHEEPSQPQHPHTRGASHRLEGIPPAWPWALIFITHFLFWFASAPTTPVPTPEPLKTTLATYSKAVLIACAFGFLDEAGQIRSKWSEDRNPELEAKRKWVHRPFACVGLGVLAVWWELEMGGLRGVGKGR